MSFPLEMVKLYYHTIQKPNNTIGTEQATRKAPNHKHDLCSCRSHSKRMMIIMEQPPVPAVGTLLDFTGKVVLITGAGGGIGQGIATRFAEAGAQIAAHYHTSAAQAEAL